MTAQNPEKAQRSLDVFLATIGDDREHRGPGGARTTVVPWPMPSPCSPSSLLPTTTEVERVVADSATVAYQVNRYSVPPELGGTTVAVRHRLGSPTVDVVAISNLSNR